MKVNLLGKGNCNVEAEIIPGQKIRLPTIHDGWRFNFNKHAKAADTLTYALVTTDTPDVIEGCIIFKMQDKQEPYMAFIEVAPHNKGSQKQYDMVAGCLIAYACRLSFIHGKGPYKGYLAFDVQEEGRLAQEKLMKVYSSKYKARRLDNSTTMIIVPQDGEALIEKYLG